MRVRALLLLSVLPGCDYSADFLFTGGIDGVDDVLVIRPEGGQYLEPVDITSYDDIADNAIFAEVSQSTTAQLGGATMEFLGTGGDVCVLVDPEAIFWSAAIAPSPSEAGRQYSYPDNPFDDGDMDLTGGLSVFYTGSPDVVMGDFVVFYEDELGNEVPIQLADCVTPTSDLLESNGFAGKGYPEYCTFSGTQAGVAYTVAMTAWSVPLDDDRLSFGVILANGTCASLLNLVTSALPQGQAPAGVNGTQLRECVITGESLKPTDPGPHFGRPNDQVWPGYYEAEDAFCRVQGAPRLDAFCQDEADAKDDEGVECDWEAVETEDSRCFCGDLSDLPDPGAG